MHPLMLALGATLLFGAPVLIAQEQVVRPVHVQSLELKRWVTATGLDTVTLLFALAAVLLLAAALGVVCATRARRRERQSGRGRLALENTHEASEAAMAGWIEEGRQLFNLWQERVERLDELQSRLAAMALEIDQLRQEGEALLLERDHLRSALARIGELIQRASEVGPGATGGAPPEVAP